MKTKIKSITQEEINFDNGYILFSEHIASCCENHYLDFSNITPEDVKEMEFDLDTMFFIRVEGYGIELLSTNNFPLRIPGYAENNGYYSDTLTLIVNRNGSEERFNITECQSYKY